KLCKIGPNMPHSRQGAWSWARKTAGSPLPSPTKDPVSTGATSARDPACRTCRIEWPPWAACWRCAPRPAAGQPWPGGCPRARWHERLAVRRSKTKDEDEDEDEDED